MEYIYKDNDECNLKKTQLYIAFDFFYYAILFCCTTNIRLISTHYFIMKILNKRELQQIAFNYSSDINFQDFKNL